MPGSRLARGLDSKPDDASAMDGKALVGRKVRPEQIIRVRQVQAVLCSQPPRAVD